MYNRYPRGSDLYYTCEEAIDAVKTLDESRDNVEAVFEDLVGQLDTVTDERDEFEEQANEAEKELEEYKTKYMDLHALTDLNELINHMTQLKLAGEAIVRFADDKLVAAGALNATEDSDSTGGAGSDGGGEAADNEDDRVTAAEGIDRIKS